MESKRYLSGESVDLFREGICLLLSKWSALQLAVENEWGGRGSRQLADQLFSDIFTWFITPTKEPRYVDDLENILDEAMLTLNTIAEDGSVEEIAENLMIMHEECLEGNYSSVIKLRESGPGASVHQHVSQVVDDEDSSMTDESNMMVDEAEMQSKSQSERLPVCEPERKQNEPQAEDGWVVVSSKRNKSKRN